MHAWARVAEHRTSARALTHHIHKRNVRIARNTGVRMCVCCDSVRGALRWRASQNANARAHAHKRSTHARASVHFMFTHVNACGVGEVVMRICV